MATNGLWVLNENVKVVDHPGVCKYGKCGYFPGNGTLEIPFFVNNYQNFKQFSISLFYGLTAGASYQVRLRHRSHALSLSGVVTHTNTQTHRHTDKQTHRHTDTHSRRHIQAYT